MKTAASRRRADSISTCYPEPGVNLPQITTLVYLGEDISDGSDGEERTSFKGRPPRYFNAGMATVRQ
jgi:hypothetical protein